MHIDLTQQANALVAHLERCMAPDPWPLIREGDLGG
jgi:hypothetical protein